MADHLDPPEVKLLLRRNLASQFGREFDENRERIVLGLPTVENPDFIAEDDGRRRETQRLEREHKRDLEDAAKAAEQSAKDSRMAALEAQNAAQQSQINDLMAALGRGEKAVVDGALPAAAATEGNPAPLPDGIPDINTVSLREIVQWGVERGVPAPPNGGNGLSKAFVLNGILEELAKREAEATATAPVVSE